jgi:dTDP-4-dehydrorhamnose reductase
MRVLITGALGQLGRECTSLLARDHAIRAVDLDDLDICDPDAVDGAVSAFRPDVVVNCAAFTDVDGAEEAADAARRVNVDGPGNLAVASARTGARLVHVSTDYVFDGSRPVPGSYSEDDAPAPRSCYGRTKLEGERRVLNEAAFPVVVRTAWLYGEHGRCFPKAILARALSRPGEPLRVVNDQFGSPTWAYRLALQIARLLEAPEPGIYHATAEGWCSWYDFARLFLERMGVDGEVLPCTSAEFPRPAQRPANAILDNARLRAQDRSVMVDWKADVERFVSSCRDRLIAEVE